MTACNETLIKTNHVHKWCTISHHSHFIKLLMCNPALLASFTKGFFENTSGLSWYTVICLLDSLSTIRHEENNVLLSFLGGYHCSYEKRAELKVK